MARNAKSFIPPKKVKKSLRPRSHVSLLEAKIAKATTLCTPSRRCSCSSLECVLDHFAVVDTVVDTAADTVVDTVVDAVVNTVVICDPMVVFDWVTSAIAVIDEAVAIIGIIVRIIGIAAVGVVVSIVDIIVIAPPGVVTPVIATVVAINV